MEDEIEESWSRRNRRELEQRDRIGGAEHHLQRATLQHSRASFSERISCLGSPHPSLLRTSKAAIISAATGDGKQNAWRRCAANLHKTQRKTTCDAARLRPLEQATRRR